VTILTLSLRTKMEENLDSILKVIRVMEVIFVILLPALILHLEKRFTTKSEFNSLGERLTGIQSVAMNANTMADKAMDKIDLLESRSEDRWERNVEALERISTTIKVVSDQLMVVSNNQIITSRDLKHLSDTINKARV
jgi:biotin synthase-related radical SAM superfamily protein